MGSAPSLKHRLLLYRSLWDPKQVHESLDPTALTYTVTSMLCRGRPVSHTPQRREGKLLHIPKQMALHFCMKVNTMLDILSCCYHHATELSAKNPVWNNYREEHAGHCQTLNVQTLPSTGSCSASDSAISCSKLAISEGSNCINSGVIPARLQHSEGITLCLIGEQSDISWTVRNCVHSPAFKKYFSLLSVPRTDFFYSTVLLSLHSSASLVIERWKQTERWSG